jgi:hypothetical protein
VIDRAYQLLYGYLELYENRFEASVATIEIGLIGWGLYATLSKVFGESGEGRPARIEMAFESAEFVIFLLLLLTATSRFLISIRKTRLGYAYDRILEKFGADDDPAAFQRFRSLVEAAPLGYAPGLLPGWPDRIQDLADRIAIQTASRFSLRSWLTADRLWQRRERDSLSEWFREFPAALWVVPEVGDHAVSPDARSGGYFSIIVPMTRHSRRSIRQGQRATDLAELAPEIRARFDPERNGGCHGSSAEWRGKRPDLLAYLHIHVPPESGARARDDTRLLAANIQHLAFLLHAIHGSARDGVTPEWSFTVLCESSNRGLNAILKQLGFKRVEREPDGSETQRRDVRSYAGFTLFELVIEAGECEVAEGRNLLVMLRRMAANLSMAVEPTEQGADLTG